MRDLLFGTTLLASFLGGMVALLAPCCVSVMLPAYLAAGFRRRTGILAATLVFAAGVATAIVPIGLGASALTALVSGHHLLVFSLGGAAMLVGGAAVLAGWKPQLPLPAGRAPGGHGFGSVYGLGLFSGAASSCCAPVLAGVAVLSGAAASFPAALAVSLAYVAGMVAPLCLLALVWDRRDWGATRLLHGRQVTWRLGRWRRAIPLGTAASGVLLLAMGALTTFQAVRGPDMASGGWRLRLAADLQHAASLTTSALAWLPGWVFAILLASAVGCLARQAAHHLGRDRAATPTTPPPCCESPRADPHPVPASPAGKDA
ncbi:cytochrome c biogenesis protein CcdA [Streptomyces sp. H10-C2]|uniref:cytochrome c biogenesis CcdA family protein n=1 Tax=unclassified Streptomyces TaxID=2593676 RepID=UPI0024B88287|nr:MULTISPECIES: cytochrome c biogenesis protein CcdA [unclassified Streptomyces]MDJ0341045.1 cytochrome c biogenesis protein CcdA [Streptomyces sp. PH10-H1]MDJ0369723.1 cytochrome c biogenesis protein CcdA [Streptomyces sp. H10-C2]